MFRFFVGWVKNVVKVGKYSALFCVFVSTKKSKFNTSKLFLFTNQKSLYSFSDLKIRLFLVKKRSFLSLKTYLYPQSTPLTTKIIL